LCDAQFRCIAPVADGRACKVDKQFGIDDCDWPARCAGGVCTLDAPACN
jgi:hypothetical protein